jgi:hypothetical protein
LSRSVRLRPAVSGRPALALPGTRAATADVRAGAQSATAAPAPAVDGGEGFRDTLANYRLAPEDDARPKTAALTMRQPPTSRAVCRAGGSDDSQADIAALAHPITEAPAWMLQGGGGPVLWFCGGESTAAGRPVNFWLLPAWRDRGWSHRHRSRPADLS